LYSFVQIYIKNKRFKKKHNFKKKNTFLTIGKKNVIQAFKKNYFKHQKSMLGKLKLLLNIESSIRNTEFGFSSEVGGGGGNGLDFKIFTKSTAPDILSGPESGFKRLHSGHFPMLLVDC
jgi:hypothetical protein